MHRCINYHSRCFASTRCLLQLRLSLEGLRQEQSLTRSVGMNLARRFNAGIESLNCSRRVATLEASWSQTSLRDAKIRVPVFPALKGRAKFTSTLRVERSGSGFIDHRRFSKTDSDRRSRFLYRFCFSTSLCPTLLADIAIWKTGETIEQRKKPLGWTFPRGGRRRLRRFQSVISI